MNEEYPRHGAQDPRVKTLMTRTRVGACARDSWQPAAGGRPAAPTGDDRVDAAVAGQRRPACAPRRTSTSPCFEEVHGRLRDILGELDEGQDRPVEPGGAKGRP